MLVWWLAACPNTEDSTPSHTETGDSGHTPTFALGCRPDPGNRLRALCGFERDGTGPISVTLTGAGEPPKTFDGDPDLLIGEIVGWDLLEETAWDWVLTDRGTVVDSGTLVTDSLAPAYAPDVDVIVDGPSSVDRQLFSLRCGRGPTLFMMDAQNRVRWYQDVGDFGFISGYTATDRGTVAALMDRTTIGEWSFDGTEITFYTNPGALPYRIHHALTDVGEALYSLDVQLMQLSDGLSYLVDGVTVVQDGAGEHVWNALEVVDPIGLTGDSGAPYWLGIFPTGIDFAHTNSLDVLDDGGWLMSMKHLDSVVRVNPDGTLRWAIKGEHNAATFYGPELTLTSSAGLDATFQHPHHASMSPWGTVLLFDNGNVRNGTDVFARAVELAIDEGAGTADVVGAWELNQTCPVQSSVFPLPDGSLLAACAATRNVFELDGAGVRRQFEVTCSDLSGSSSFVRVQPLSLTTAATVSP